MRIESLTLENFRSYGDSQRFDFTDRVLIIGENGTGKSSIVDALEWVLTGRCRGVDGTGKGQKELIRSGAGKMSGTLKLAGLPAITRTYDKGGRKTCTLPEDAILAKLDTTAAYLRAVLNGGVFFDLHHAEAKKLLMDVLNVTVAPEQLPGLGVTEPLTLDALEDRYRKATDDRLVAKRALQAIVVPEIQAKVHLHGVDPAQVRADLNAAQNDYRAKAQAEAKVAADVRTLRERVSAAEAAEVNLPHLQAKRDAHADLLAREQEKRARLVAELADLPAAEDRSGLAGKVAEAQTLISKIEQHDPDRGCVLNAAIPCLTEAVRFAGQVGQLKADVGELGRRITVAAERDQARQQVAADIRSADVSIAYHERQQAEAHGKVEAATGALAALDDLRANLRELVQQEKAASAELAAAKVTSEAKQALFTDATTYAAAVAAQKTAQEARQAAQDDVARQEQLVELLGPTGVRLQALELAVGDFLGAINAMLEPFGFTLLLQVDPWGVTVFNATRRTTVPYALMSSGERVFVGLAFQAALAGLSGLDFYAVDAAETVVGARRKVLTDVVMHAPIGQVIVAMAKGADDPAPVIDGLQVIRLEDAAVPA